MWLIALIYGLITSFNGLSLEEFGVLSVLMGISLLVDYFSGVLGAKIGGASMRSLGLGFLGLMLGLLLFPPLGGVIGLFVGILASELNAYKDRSKAIRAATGGVVGVLAGAITNLVVGIGFIVYFVMVAA